MAPVDFIEMGRDTNSRVDQAAVERSWRERGFSCGLWVDPPGQVWADYVHDTDELVMVVEGDVEFGALPGRCPPRATNGP